jgi:hypothetical protein
MAVPKKKKTHMRKNIKYKKSNNLLLNKIYGFKIQDNRYMHHNVDYVTDSPRKSHPDGSRLKLRIDDARFSIENRVFNPFSKRFNYTP